LRLVTHFPIFCTASSRHPSLATQASISAPVKVTAAAQREQRLLDRRPVA